MPGKATGRVLAHQTCPVHRPDRYLSVSLLALTAALAGYRLRRISGGSDPGVAEGSDPGSPWDRRAHPQQPDYAPQLGLPERPSRAQQPEGPQQTERTEAAGPGPTAAPPPLPPVRGGDGEGVTAPVAAQLRRLLGRPVQVFVTGRTAPLVGTAAAVIGDLLLLCSLEGPTYVVLARATAVRVGREAETPPVARSPGTKPETASMPNLQGAELPSPAWELIHIYRCRRRP